MTTRSLRLLLIGAAHQYFITQQSFILSHGTPLFRTQHDSSGALFTSTQDQLLDEHTPDILGKQLHNRIPDYITRHHLKQEHTPKYLGTRTLIKNTYFPTQITSCYSILHQLTSNYSHTKQWCRPILHKGFSIRCY